MKGPVTSAAGLLPLVLLTGCFQSHRQMARIQPLAPPLVEAPPPEPPPQVASAPEPPAVMENTPEPEPEPPPEPEPKKHVRHHKATPKDSAAPSPPDVADNSVPALGQISSGDPPDLRLQTQNSISYIEQQLSSIRGNVTEQDKHTIEHIREFLNQAKKALATGDVDGASTLAAKAKVLLAEVPR